MDILAALYTLRDMAVNGEVPCPYWGISLNIWRIRSESQMSNDILWIGRNAEDWDFCGDHCYDPIFEIDKICATSAIPGCGSIWTGKPLRARLSLIDHLIEKVEEGTAWLPESMQEIED